LWQVALLNAAVMGLTFTFAALDLQISLVLRFTGAIAGLVLIFAIPIAIDVKERLRDGKLGVMRGVLHASIIALGVAVFIMQFL
jgi:sodium-coupled neutral amino acid transporter 9